MQSHLRRKWPSGLPRMDFGTEFPPTFRERWKSLTTFYTSVNSLRLTVHFSSFQIQVWGMLTCTQTSRSRLTISVLHIKKYWLHMCFSTHFRNITSLRSNTSPAVSLNIRLYTHCVTGLILSQAFLFISHCKIQQPSPETINSFIAWF